MASLEPGCTAHDSATFRHSPEKRQRHKETVCHNKKPYGKSRQDNKLRRRRAGRRTDTTVGNAKGRSGVPGGTSLDFIAHRRSHTRRIRQAEGLKGLRVALRSRIVPRHRRLAPRHERHKALHAQVRRTGTQRATAIGGKGADTYARHDCKKAGRNRQLRAAALLVAHNSVQGSHVHRHERKLHRRSRSACRTGGDTRQGLHRRHRCNKRGARSTAAAVRPYFAAGGMQQEVRLFGRQDAANNPSALRKAHHNLPPRRHNIPSRRHIPQMQGRAEFAVRLRHAARTAERKQTEEKQKGVRLVESYRPPCHNPNRRVFRVVGS